MKKYTITDNDADQRLDKFLKKLLPKASLSFIYKLNRKGNIKIITHAWKKTKQDNEYKLNSWEQVHVFLPDSEISELSEKKEKIHIVEKSRKLSEKDIAYEDDDLLIVNKNPGCNVHPGDHKSDEVSLIEQVDDYYKSTLDSFTFKPSLIHRIDRDTSGIIMIAKKKNTLTKLGSDFKKHDALKKTYTCIVLWKLSRKKGTVTKKLKRVENAKSENKVQVDDSGLEAITHYKCIWEYKLKLPENMQTLSLLEVTIETGRMHQIRVHLAAIGNPILWDKTYGNKKLNSYFSKYFKISRHMLHALQIEFFHPGKQKKMSVKAQIKKDMKQFLDILKET